MNKLILILLALIPGLIGYPIFQSIYGPKKLDSNSNYWVKHILYISRALTFACLWPIIGVLLIIDKILAQNQKSKRAVNKMKDLISGKSMNDGKLRYWKMGGAGNFQCRECSYNDEIVSFLHGFGKDPWSNSGYQCQKCGKFCSIEYANKLESIPNCKCGGSLSRGEAIFCPVCKSYKVGYQMTVIT